ncbi:MAG: hypothetical protein Q9216_003991 [Gyalolechia sp. 2 TL-2023]
MGRKPNQLILEYFDRGAKLADNSNRYEHWCKACGEHFPKGRIESLVAHVDKRCINVRRDESGDVPSLHDSPRPTSFINEKAIGATDHLDGRVAAEHRRLLPVSSRRSLTGLEALAEASRQLEHPKKADAAQVSQHHLIDPGLETRPSIFRHPGFDTDLGGEGEDHLESYTNHSTAATDEDSAVSGGPNLGPYVHHGHHSTGARTSQDPTMLSLIAASASNLEASMPRAVHEQQNETTTIKPPLSQQCLASAVMVPMDTSGLPDSAADSATGSSLETVSGNPASENPGLDHVSKFPTRSVEKPHGRAQKVRGKFTDSRRQEVQNVRKKGACIRCRMLRKTCSGESPCKTCASVTSARVWKLGCMRTNIYREIDMFYPRSKDPGMSNMKPSTTGLFSSLSSRLLEQWHSQRVSESDRCFIRVTRTSCDKSPMLFPARWYKRNNNDGSRGGKQEVFESDRNTVFLDESKEQISITLLSHVESTISHLDDSDPNNLIGPTCRLASTLTREGHDRLLEQTLELWALTEVMTSNRDDWQCLPYSSRSHAEEARQPSTIPEVSTNPGSMSIESREYTVSQLKASAEHRASTISKNVMIELERRLERKERCQGFETFLVGFLLLNCVERMCWVFQYANDTAKGLNVRWPPEKPVEYYLDQAARFADFLSKLYKMRGILLPVCQQAEDGILHANTVNVTLADQWLSELRLTARLAVIKPFLLSDIGEGIKEVQIIQWFVEPEARVEQFDKLCEVQSDKAAVEITSRFDGVIKKLHYEPEDMAQVGKPLCDIDVLSEISPDDEAALGSTSEQAGAPSSPQQPQKAAEQHQVQENQAAKPQNELKPPPSGKHGSLATPAVRGLLKELNVDISEVTGTGKDGRVLKEDVHKHASSNSKPSTPPPSTASSTTTPTSQTESPITLTPIQSQMFKTMTRSLSIPHLTFADELDITALSRLRTQLNQDPHPLSSAKLSYLPFIIKALSLALYAHPLLNSRVDTSTSPSRPRLILRSQHNIGIAIDCPQGLIVPNIKSVNERSIPDIAAELSRLHALAQASKLTASDLTGGTITVSNVGSIGGTYVSPIIASETEVAILGIGKKRVVPAFDDEGELTRKEVMHFSWSADHRVVDGASVARCAEAVRGMVERPERMVLGMR